MNLKSCSIALRISGERLSSDQVDMVFELSFSGIIFRDASAKIEPENKRKDIKSKKRKNPVVKSRIFKT